MTKPALFRCEECGNAFRARRRRCPHCGTVGKETTEETCRDCGVPLVDSKFQTCSVCGSENVERIDS